MIVADWQNIDGMACQQIKKIKLIIASRVSDDQQGEKKSSSLALHVVSDGHGVRQKQL